MYGMGQRGVTSRVPGGVLGGDDNWPSEAALDAGLSAGDLIPRRAARVVGLPGRPACDFTCMRGEVGLEQAGSKAAS